MNLTPEQKKLLRLAKVVDEGGVAIAQELLSLEEKVDTAVADIKASVPDVKSLLEQVKGAEGVQGIQGEKGDTGAKGDTGEQGVQGEKGQDSTVAGPKGDKGDKGDKGEDGKDGTPADEEAIVKKLESEFPQFGNAFRDGLELLKGEERLDVSAIKGLDTRDTTLTDAIINRAIGIVDQRTSFLINKVSNLKAQVDNLPTNSGGSGVVQTIVAGTGISVDSTDPANPIVTNTVSGATGITRTVVVTSGSITLGSAAATDYVYSVAGAHTLSMPSPNTNQYTVKNNHSANITINTAGAELIEGAASISIAPEESVDIVSDGTNWYVV